VAALLQVFPGQGTENNALAYAPGWANVTGQVGDFLDSWLGQGGSGARAVGDAGPILLVMPA
jgi:hypothetical protein